jgi:hypothetical protein
MSDAVCEPYGKTVDIGITVISHVVILFFILSMFFIFYVSNITSTTFNRELDHQVTTNIDRALIGLTSEEQLALRAALKAINFDRLIKFYSQPDKTVKAHNEWLFRTVIIVNVILMVLTVLTISTAKMLCYDVHIGHLALETFLIFLGVGVVEFMFFKFVASQYVPAPPSLMVKSIIDSLQNSLKN